MPPLGFGQVETMSARVLDIRALSEELPLHSSDDRTAVAVQHNGGQIVAGCNDAHGSRDGDFHVSIRKGAACQLN